jgi:hypothetical protein
LTRDLAQPTDPAPELAHRLDLVKAVVHTGLHGRINAERDDPAVANQTITVDTGNVEVTDFSIGPELKQRLFDDGYRAAESFLAGNDFGLEGSVASPASSSPPPGVVRR